MIKLSVFFKTKRRVGKGVVFIHDSPLTYSYFRTEGETFLLINLLNFRKLDLLYHKIYSTLPIGINYNNQ